MFFPFNLTVNEGKLWHNLENCFLSEFLMVSFTWLTDFWLTSSLYVLEILNAKNKEDRNEYCVPSSFLD